MESIPMAARSKASVYGRSFAGVVSSILAGVLDVSVLPVLCVVCASDWTLGVLLSVVCPVSVIAKPLKGKPWPRIG